MLRQPMSSTSAFIKEVSRDQIPEIHTAFFEVMIGVLGYIGSISYSVKTNDSNDASRYQISIFLLLAAVTCLADLLTRGTLRAVDAKNEWAKIHVNKKKAIEFFLKHPNYPADKKENGARITCPFSREESEHPICISYTLEGKRYMHAYDYHELKNYFLSEQGFRCIVTNINLCEDKVNDLKFSFDIPDEVPERVPAKVDETQHTVEVANMLVKR